MESGLRPGVAVVDQAGHVLAGAGAGPQRHLEGVEWERGRHRRVRAPRRRHPGHRVLRGGAAGQRTAGPVTTVDRRGRPSRHGRRGQCSGGRRSTTRSGRGCSPAAPRPEASSERRRHRRCSATSTIPRSRRSGSRIDRLRGTCAAGGGWPQVRVDGGAASRLRGDEPAGAPRPQLGLSCPGAEPPLVPASRWVWPGVRSGPRSCTTCTAVSGSDTSC